MVLLVSFKQALSSISRSQWVIIIFFIAMVPIVFLLVHFLNVESTIEQGNELDEMYGRVIYVNMMFRHGARNPDRTTPKDPYGDVSVYWPGGFGALTTEGILQHIRLGKWIARRYRHLLPNDWMLINDAIRVVSTDWNRTLMSAEAEMAGIFPIPPQDIDAWEGLTSYPVPIHSLSPEEDGLLELTKECQKYKVLVEASRASEEYQSILRHYKNTSDYIEQHSGELITDIRYYRFLHTVYSIEENRGLALPSWLEKVYPSPIRELAVMTHIMPTWNVALKRLRGGPFVKELLGSFRRKLNGTLSLNISMYSAHDTSLSAAMGAMDIFNNEIPPFAALLLFELRAPKNGTEPVVMLWYKNTTSDPFLLHLPGCGVACPLTEMEQLLLPVIPDDWDKECEQVPTISP